MTNARKLAHDFLNLPRHQQAMIAKSLGLLMGGTQPEPTEIFRHAVLTKQVQRLKDLVSAHQAGADGMF